MSPRRGRTGTVLRVRFVVLAVARVRRASWEITRPAVDFCLVASSLAAWRTSSSISTVVRMHLMLLHHSQKSTTISGGPPKTRARTGIRSPRRLSPYKKSRRNFANLAVLPDDHRQTASAKLDAFFPSRTMVGAQSDASPFGHFFFGNWFQAIM